MEDLVFLKYVICKVTEIPDEHLGEMYFSYRGNEYVSTWTLQSEIVVDHGVTKFPMFWKKEKGKYVLSDVAYFPVSLLSKKQEVFSLFMDKVVSQGIV